MGADELKIFRGPDGFKRIQPDWATVIAQIGSPSLVHLPDWYGSYLDSLEERPQDVVFCGVYEGGAPIAIIPLKQETRTIAGVRLRTLELPRHDHMHLRDIIVRDASRGEFSAAKLSQLLRQSREVKWDVLALWHCIDDSAAMTAYRVGAPHLADCTLRFACNHLELAPWDELSKRLSSGFRRNLKNANNRAKAMEGLHFESANTVADLERAFPAFLDLEASGWKGQSGSAIKLSPRLLSFYENLLHRFGARGQCEIHLLKHGDRPVCGVFLLLTKDTVFAPKIGYDEEYSRISPGHLMQEYALKQHGQRPNLREFNILSDAKWFDVWKPLTRGVYNVYIFNTTLMGLAAATATSLAKRWRGEVTQPSIAGETAEEPKLDTAA